MRLFNGFGGFGGRGGLGGSFGNGIFGGFSSGGFSSGGYSSSSYMPSVIPNNDKIIRDAVKNSDTLAGELIRTIDDAKEEFHELCADGFVEMVIKGNSDYKTSFEIKEDADNKINDAVCRYQDRCYEFNKYLEDLNNIINELYKKKVEIAKRISKIVNNMPNMPKMAITINAPIYKYKASTISMICEYSGLSVGYDIKARKSSANDYLEDAMDYEVEISGKIAEINRVQAFLDTVKMNLAEEEQLICALNDSLDMQRCTCFDKISEQIHILIAEYVLDTNGKKNERYLEAISQLKRLI